MISLMITEIHSAAIHGKSRKTYDMRSHLANISLLVKGAADSVEEELERYPVSLQSLSASAGLGFPAGHVSLSPHGTVSVHGRNRDGEIYVHYV